MKTPTLTLLMAALAPGAAYALGLGDMVVQSHLGEPLRASVAILDAPRGLQSDCFSVRDGHDASLPGTTGARVALDMRAPTPVLIITTAQPVNDPILQMALVAGCEVPLQRDYMLLLDPPLAVELAAVPAAVPAAATAPQDAAPQAAASETATSEVAASEAAVPQVAPPKRTRPRSPRRATQTADALPSARATQANTLAPAKTQTIKKPGVSRLIVSSGRHTPDAASASSDKAQALSLTQLQEENAALNHRLAHLEAQLEALQKHSRELDRARLLAAAPPVVADPPAASLLWPRYLAGFAALVGVVALALWLRRQGRSKPRPAAPQLAKARPARTPSTVHTPERMPEESIPERVMPSVVAPTPSSAARFQLSTAGTEVKEDILDQAEVYMAHGRSSLAIHLLQEHLRVAPTESPVPWLLLLDLMKRDGLDAEYRETCLACQTYFNVNLSAPPAAAPTPDGGCIEAYPHVVAQLQKVWGTRAAEDFLTDLVYDHRGGTRLGFDSGTYREIVMLRSIAMEYGKEESPARMRRI